LALILNPPHASDGSQTNWRVIIFRKLFSLSHQSRFNRQHLARSLSHTIFIKRAQNLLTPQLGNKQQQRKTPIEPHEKRLKKIHQKSRQKNGTGKCVDLIFMKVINK
jgi:hypothetical protein